VAGLIETRPFVCIPRRVSRHQVPQAQENTGAYAWAWSYRPGAVDHGTADSGDGCWRGSYCWLWCSSLACICSVETRPSRFLSSSSVSHRVDSFRSDPTPGASEPGLEPFAAGARGGGVTALTEAMEMRLSRARRDHSGRF